MRNIVVQMRHAATAICSFCGYMQPLRGKSFRCMRCWVLDTNPVTGSRSETAQPRLANQPKKKKGIKARRHARVEEVQRVEELKREKAELDSWWQTIQTSQGRKATRLKVREAPPRSAFRRYPSFPGSSLTDWDFD
jgi:hypothetical protein